MPAARSALCDCARLDTLRSETPGMAVEDPFHNADARRKAGAVADPARREKLRPGDRRRQTGIAARTVDRAGGMRAGRSLLREFPWQRDKWTAARRPGAGARLCRC